MVTIVFSGLYMMEDINDTPLLTPVCGGDYGYHRWYIIRGLPLSSFRGGLGVIHGMFIIFIALYTVVCRMVGGHH